MRSSTEFIVQVMMTSFSAFCCLFVCLIFFFFFFLSFFFSKFVIGTPDVYIRVLCIFKDAYF